MSGFLANFKAKWAKKTAKKDDKCALELHFLSLFLSGRLHFVKKTFKIVPYREQVPGADELQASDTNGVAPHFTGHHIQCLNNQVLT
jgi:hypothetical protein